MLCRARLLRGVSPFGLFMKESHGHPALAALGGRSRGAAMAKLYRALSASELAGLKKRAAKMPKTRASATRAGKKARAGGGRGSDAAAATAAASSPSGARRGNPGAFAAFVRRNMKKVPGHPTERFRTLGAMWKARKQRKGT